MQELNNSQTGSDVMLGNVCRCDFWMAVVC